MENLKNKSTKELQIELDNLKKSRNERKLKIEIIEKINRYKQENQEKQEKTKLSKFFSMLLKLFLNFGKLINKLLKKNYEKQLKK